MGDAPYLKPVPAITLIRTAEMYAWDESGDDEDGYTYRKEWTSSPENSENFERPNGHFNPPMSIRSDEHTLEDAQIGQFTVFPPEMIFRQIEDVQLTEGLVSGGRVDGNYFYEGNAEPNAPEIGDIRLGYTMYAADQFTTVFGEQQERRVVSWSDGESIIYRGYALDRQGGIDALRTEYLTALWGFRFGGLAMFYIGLMMMLSPLTNILGYIPILGNVGNRVLAFAAFVVAFVIWLVTLTIAIILHNIVALLVVLVIVGGVGYYFWSQRREKSPKDLDYGTSG
ncbi:MAG: TMEM43 family protein [Chloroflexota bacterium]